MHKPVTAFLVTLRVGHFYATDPSQGRIALMRAASRGRCTGHFDVLPSQLLRYIVSVCHFYAFYFDCHVHPQGRDVRLAPRWFNAMYLPADGVGGVQ